MVILSMLIFPILEHGIAFHLFLSSSNSSNKHWFCILEKKKKEIRSVSGAGVGSGDRLYEDLRDDGNVFFLGSVTTQEWHLSELIESVHLKYMHFIVSKLYLKVDEKILYGSTLWTEQKMFACQLWLRSACDSWSIPHTLPHTRAYYRSAWPIIVLQISVEWVSG